MERDAVVRFNSLKKIITWFSVGILLGSGIGLLKAIRVVNAQQYVKYGMNNLIRYYLQTSLNKWILICFVVSLFGIIASLALSIGGRWLHKNIVAVQIVDRNRALALLLSLLLSIVLFFWYGPLVLLKNYPATDSVSAFLRSSYHYVASFFYVPLLLRGFSIVAVSCLIVVGFSWLLVKIGIAERLSSAGKILTSRWTTIAAVFMLVSIGLLNVFANYGIGRGGHRHKNIIMISVDTLRADHMGCYGYFRNTSPFMDSIARKGVFFENAFTPWPVTTPAVASVFTSQYGHTNGVTRITPYQHVGDELLLLTEILKNQGFSTEAIVSNTAIKSSNIDQGFDTFVDISGESDAKAVNKEAFKAVDRIKQKQQDGKPFFLWIHYIDPHAPYKPPEFGTQFVGDRYYNPNKHLTFRDPLVEEVKTYQDQNISPYEKLRRTLLASPMGSAPPNLVDKTTTEVAYHMAMYDAEIRFADQQIGILLNRLEEQGLLKDSIIILWADHGESLGDHNYYLHGRFPYDSCLKVPFMIVNPEYQPRKIKVPVSTLDLMPTILDMLDIKQPVDFEGISLVPVIDGNKLEQRDIFAESGYAIDFQKIMIRGEWKLIYIPDDHDRSAMQGKPFELYNLSRDPGETRDLSESNPQVLREMKKSLFVWMDSWKESFMSSDAQHGQKVEYSQEALEKLRSLGYVK